MTACPAGVVGATTNTGFQTTARPYFVEGWICSTAIRKCQADLQLEYYEIDHVGHCSGASTVLVQRRRGVLPVPLQKKYHRVDKGTRPALNLQPTLLDSVIKFACQIRPIRKRIPVLQKSSYDAQLPPP
jgi:hypothetical protein